MDGIRSSALATTLLDGQPGRFRSVPEHVGQLLVEAIIDGRLAPGQRVTEMELAKAFDVSRTPVREAMRILEAQGLIVRRRSRSTYIASRTSWEEALVLYRLRTPLESYLTGLAADQITPEELEQLARLQADFRAALKPSAVDRRALIVADSNFHWTIFGAAHSDLVSIVHSYSGRLLRELSDRVYRSRPPATFADQHDTIVAALEERDAEGARRLAAEHIETSWRAVSDSFERGAPEAGGSLAEPPRHRGLVGSSG